jgi:methylaspartate mutase epsilon subunit
MRPFSTIAIVGGGPRGLAVAEQIAIGLRCRPERAPVLMLLIDDHQPGAGRIWRTTQSSVFLMNTVAGQVTLYSGPRDAGPIRPGHGPSLYEWLKDHPDPSYAPANPNTYATRRAYGEYMQDVLQSFIAEFPRPHSLEPLHARVADVVPRGDQYELEFEGQHWPILVDAVVLATGHATARLRPEEKRWQEFAAASKRCRYQPGDAAADLGLERIESQESVGVIGLGLGFHDILAALTTGRGGRFEAGKDGLIYVPSGREPTIVAGSRSALPIPARGANQKVPGSRFAPQFFHVAAVQAAHRRAVSASGSPSLSFRKDLYPLILAEMEHVYYTTWVRSLYGPESAVAFAGDHARLRDPHAPVPESLLRQYQLAEAPRLNLVALARPFEGMRFGATEEFRQALAAYLQRDLQEALRGNVDSPLKAALDVLRDVRDTLRAAVEFDGLRVGSFEHEFQRDFAPLCSLLSAGPPAARVSQLLAIQAAGILRIIGPDLAVHCDSGEDCFRLSSPSVPGHGERVTVLLDSRVPFPSLAHTQNSLLQALRQRGLVRSYSRVAEDGEASVSGGIDVLPPSFQVVGRNGKANPRIFAIGLPTESPRWFTQVGSATPGTVSQFTRDAMAVSQGILGALDAAALGAPAELEVAA